MDKKKDGYAESQEAEQHYKDLSAWAWLNEDVIIEALKACAYRHPSHLVSSYERALDSYKKIMGK